MKILVCGGRDYSDRDALYRALDIAHAQKKITMIIHGGQSGADIISGDWAKLRGVLFAVVEAPWKFYGKPAGPMRNRGMLTLLPDGLIAFPGNKGTADMVSIAEAAGIKCWKPYG